MAKDACAGVLVGSLLIGLFLMLWGMPAWSGPVLLIYYLVGGFTLAFFMALTDLVALFWSAINLMAIFLFAVIIAALLEFSNRLLRIAVVAVFTVAYASAVGALHYALPGLVTSVAS